MAKCLYTIPAMIPSCQQRNLALSHVASTKRRLTLLRARNLRWPPPQSPGAIQANTMCRSRFFSAGSATPISTRSETSGASMPTVYPCVPGHEIVGRVTKVGSAVTKFKPGDLAAVGCLVDSDGTCPECQDGLEQFCPNMTLTYNSPDKHLGGVTYGGYSDSIVVEEHFVLRVPPNLESRRSRAALCAGITTYSPMRHWGVTKGKKVGVVGLGGLGHMGVKFAHALGAHVVVFTTSPSKKEDALRLGADEVVISRNADEMQKHAGSFDFILDAVSADHDINAYISCFAATATLRWSAHRTSLCRSRRSALFSDVAVSPARPLAVLPKRRRCSTFAANITSPPMLKSFQSRRSTKLTSDCQVRCEVPLLHRHGFSEGLMVKNGHQARRLKAFHQMAGGVFYRHSEN